MPRHNKLSKLDPCYQILDRVPVLEKTGSIHPVRDLIAIIDLETTGLDHRKEGITEIGIVVFSHTNRTFLDYINIYSSFNDSGKYISKDITRLTGITQEMVKGKYIDWAKVKEVLEKVTLIVCHNAAFDRKFLEQTELGDYFKQITFACTKNDINWNDRGFNCNKLDYLNWKLGFFYDGHRAINDCWATLNLLRQDEGALQELLDNSKEIVEVYAVDAPYEYKDDLKGAGFKWNNGTNFKPKAWYVQTRSEEELKNVKEYLKKLGNLECELRVVSVNRKYSSEV